MNILPHKSWHVWKASNIEKVERDEANYRREQAEERKKAIEQQGKERFAILTGKPPPMEDTPTVQDNHEQKTSTEIDKHINFFAEEEKKQIKSLKSVRTTLPSPIFSNRKGLTKMKKKRKNEELAQKLVGACPLGKFSMETMKKKPWYFDAPRDNEEKQILTRKEERRQRRREKEKRSLDPMAAVKRDLRKREVAGKDRKSAKREKEDRLLSLREKRLKREEMERKKSLHLVQNKPRRHTTTTTT